MTEHERARILHEPPHKWALSHCACAVDGVSIAQVTSSRLYGNWRQASDLYRAPLPRKHEMLFNPMGASGVVVLNRAARKLFQAFQYPRPLRTAPERQLAQLDLLQPVNSTYAQPDSHLRKPQVLTAWLHVTNACNLRCTYCFVRKNEEVMSEETGQAALEAVFRSAQANDFKAVKLKYAGGEPTLNFALIRSLHRHACALSQTTGIDLQEVLLSNGIALTPDMLGFVRESGMILSISLDGLDSGHDDQRVFINGQGSASLVRNSIERALDHGVPPHLSITVTKNNVDYLVDVVAFALKRSLFFNLNLYQKHDPTRPHEELHADNERLIKGIKRVLKYIEADLPRYNVFTALLDRSNFAAPHSRACGAGDSYLVIDHHGRVARCQMEMQQPVSHVKSENPLADIRLYDSANNEMRF